MTNQKDFECRIVSVEDPSGEHPGTARITFDLVLHGTASRFSVLTNKGENPSDCIRIGMGHVRAIIVSLYEKTESWNLTIEEMERLSAGVGLPFNRREKGKPV